MSDPTSTASSALSGVEAAAAALAGAAQPTVEKTKSDPEQGNPDEADLGDAGKKAIDRMKAERNEAKQEAAALKAKLDALETANMSELDRAKKTASEAQAEVAKLPRLVADQLRGYLAGIHEIPEDKVELYLTSDDPAVLLRQAAGISERTATTTPKPDLSQGAQHSTALNGDGLTEALARAVGARQ